jgi:hypothetical protein
MLRAFLPPRTIGNAQVTSTAVLEPAYEPAGDAFDHALTSNRLDATIFDAMGHSLASGLTTSVAMAGGRNARRNEGDLKTIVETIDDALARWLPEQFCTAVFTQLDLQSGTLRWCNCGHPAPLLIRDHRVVPKAWSATRSCRWACRAISAANRAGSTRRGCCPATGSCCTPTGSPRRG